MARELGPLNIHVAHVVVDGAIDTAFIRDNFPAKYAEKAQTEYFRRIHIAERTGTCTASARCLDVRARPAPVERTLVGLGPLQLAANGSRS